MTANTTTRRRLLHLDTVPWQFNTDFPLCLGAALYTFVMTLDSLRTGLGHDDLMNLTHAWRPGIGALLLDNLLFFRVGGAHRPFGELFYWVLFDTCRFDPFPYRVFCLVLLAANSGLFLWVCRSLGMSRRSSALACYLHGYHYGFWALYYNTGTCYDLWAFFFYMLALATYVRVRRQGRATFANASILAALTVLGLNSKEMGVTLPLVLLGYEVLWHLPAAASLKEWAKDAALAWVPSTAAVAFYSAGHFGGDGSLRNLASYNPQIDVPTYWRFLERTFPEVFYAFEWPSWMVAAAGCGIGLGVVAVVRQRGPALGFLLFFAGVAPIAFIAPRSLHAAYIPTAGLAMVYGAGIGAAADRLSEMAGTVRRWPAYGALAAVAAFVLSTHMWVREHGQAREMMAAQAEEIRAIRERLQELIPEPAPGSRILLLEDPFRQVEDSWFKGWASVFLVELLYEDVHVDQRFRMNPPPDEAAIAGYDYVLTSRGARLELVSVQ